MGNSSSVPLTCRAIKCWLQGTTILHVLLYTKDDPDVRKVVKLDLNDYIGVKNGKFDVTKTKFSESTSDIGLENFILHGTVKDPDSGEYSICSLNLNLFIGVDGDDLKFMKQSTNIGDTACCFELELKTTYSALCLDSSGSLLLSSVDLDQYLGNKDGKFIAGSKNFSSTAEQVQLDETGLILSALLRNYDKEWVDATFDLSTIFANVKGELKYESPDGALDRDGIVTQFSETVPYIGYIAVAGHLRKGNNDHAKRALARTVYSTIVFAAAMTGAIVGGGPLGMAIGATAGTLVGMAAEGIIRTTVTDEDVKDDLDEISLKRFVKESLINTVSGVASGKLGKYTAKWAIGEAAQTMANNVLKRAQSRLVEEGVDKVSGQVITTASGYVIKAMEEYAANPNAEV